MSNELPQGWIATKFTELLDINGGTQPPKSEFISEPSVGYIRLLQIRDFGAKPVPTYILDNGKRKTCNKEDILIGRYGASVGRICTGMEGAYNVALAKVVKPNQINYGYLKYFLKSELFQQPLSLLSRSAQDGFNKQDLSEFDLLIPPENEQIRIADKLDSVLAKVDAAQARLEKIPALLKRFRQSVLAAATSGELTREWRFLNPDGSGQNVIDADALAKEALCKLQPELRKKKSSIESEIDSDYIFELPETWCFTTWGKMSEWITYGFTRPMPKAEAGTKLLTAKDIQYFSVEIDGAGLTTDSAFNELSDKDRPKTGDLLITKDGSIGRAALVRTNTPFCINQSVAVCWLRSTSMNRDYLELVANSDFTQKFVKDKAQGMAIQHLSIIDYAKCPLPVPPLEEQTEIVRRVESLFALADAVEKQYHAAKQRLDRLTQSLLAKAFRGELVPQDPNDEPAAELLKRIQAERQAQAPVKRTRKQPA